MPNVTPPPFDVRLIVERGIRAAAIVVAITAGGLMGRAHGMAIPIKDGGRPASLSLAGERVFFTIGAIGGAIGVVVMLRSVPRRILDRAFGLVALILAVPVGVVSGPCMVLTLLMTCFTIPREVFDFMTD